MKVRGWEMVQVGILRRPEIWADTPAGPPTFHLTISLSQSRSHQAAKFPSTNKESFIFISMERKGEDEDELDHIYNGVDMGELYSTWILVSSRVKSISDPRPTAARYCHWKLYLINIL